MADATIRAFFTEYERLTAAGDGEGLARLYAPVFQMAGPAGVQVVKSGDLAYAVAKRKQLFESIGFRPTRLVSLHETPLDERYELVRTEWQWRLDRGGSVAELTLPSTFILERTAEGLRIVFYLTHQDVMTALRERGLLPATPVNPG